MLHLFALFGLAIAIFAGFVAFTALVGWLSGNDDDCMLRWLFSCMISSAIIAVFILGYVAD